MWCNDVGIIYIASGLVILKCIDVDYMDMGQHVLQLSLIIDTVHIQYWRKLTHSQYTLHSKPATIIFISPVLWHWHHKRQCLFHAYVLCANNEQALLLWNVISKHVSSFSLQGLFWGLFPINSWWKHRLLFPATWQDPRSSHHFIMFFSIKRSKDSSKSQT